MKRLIHQRTSRVLAQEVEMANTVWSRGIGLLGRKDLPSHQALWIEGCSSIHTCFMAFPIDVVYMDSQNKILKVVRNLVPWRFSLSWGASVAIEWKAGTLADDLQPGDEVILEI